VAGVAKAAGAEVAEAANTIDARSAHTSSPSLMYIPNKTTETPCKKTRGKRVTFARTTTSGEAHPMHKLDPLPREIVINTPKVDAKQLEVKRRKAARERPADIPSTMLFEMGNRTWDISNRAARMDARREQVKMLQHRGGIQEELTPYWPTCKDARIMHLWDNRKEGFKDKKSQATVENKKRMLWLHSEPDPIAAIVRQFLWRETKPGYALSLWTDFTSTFRWLGLGDPPHDLQEFTKDLRRDAATQNTLHPEPVKEEHMDQILNEYSTFWPAESAVLHTAFVLGQRLPDMVQLSVRNFYKYSDSVVMVVSAGKTVGHTGTYTIVLPPEMEYTRAICHQVRVAKTRGWNYILSEHNTDKDRNLINDRMRAMLHSVGPVVDETCTRIGEPDDSEMIHGERKLEIRSVRRGGLQVMAMAGLSYEEILEFSKHQDVTMLLGYLDAGAKSLVHRNRMMGALRFVAETRPDRMPKAKTQ
jgi:hypothetical protein